MTALAETPLVDNVFDLFSELYDQEKREDFSLQEYLQACRDDPTLYAGVAERMIAAIGEPELIDTSVDQQLGRIFLNRTIKLYPTFKGFYGMEDTIQRIVGFFQYAAQGLEERKQILYLLGPVGGGKSSLAETLKSLIETQPIYVLKAGDEVSPILESPLGLFHPEHMGEVLEDKYGISQRRLIGLISPWAISASTNTRATFPSSRWSNSNLRSCVRSRLLRPSQVTRTIRISRRWLARSISASSNISAKTIPTPIAIQAG